LIAFQDALSEVRKLRENEGDNLSVQKLHFALLPSLIACVEEWHIENMPDEVTVDNFPATPTLQSGELIAWLQEEIMLIVTDAGTVPNE
jgi:hypothetical protein